MLSKMDCRKARQLCSPLQVIREGVAINILNCYDTSNTTHFMRQQFLCYHEHKDAVFRPSWEPFTILYSSGIYLVLLPLLIPAFLCYSLTQQAAVYISWRLGAERSQKGMKVWWSGSREITPAGSLMRCRRDWYCCPKSLLGARVAASSIAVIVPYHLQAYTTDTGTYY